MKQPPKPAVAEPLKKPAPVKGVLEIAIGSTSWDYRDDPVNNKPLAKVATKAVAKTAEPKK